MKPIIAWSHSALEGFKSCPHKHYRTRIAKDIVIDWTGEAVSWGRDVHTSLDRRLRTGAELPTNMMQYEPAARKIEALAKGTGAEIYTELQLAIDQKLNPCGWKDWDIVWGRAALDVLLLHDKNPHAVALDWKTGKRKDNDQQLAIQALFVFLHYPHVKKVVSGFVWLKDNGFIDKHIYTRENLPRLLKYVLPMVRDLTDAAIYGKWPARPSGLCQKYCEVTDCKHNGAYVKP